MLKIRMIKRITVLVLISSLRSIMIITFEFIIRKHFHPIQEHLSHNRLVQDNQINIIEINFETNMNSNQAQDHHAWWCFCVHKPDVFMNH